MLTRARGGLVALFVPACVAVALLAAPASAIALPQGGGDDASVSDETVPDDAVSTEAAAAATSSAAVVSAEAGEPEAGAANRPGNSGEAAPLRQRSPEPFAAVDRSAFGGFRVWGDLQVAYRSVDVDGSGDRFRKDYGIDTGVRVLDSRVTLVPDGESPAGWFDRIELFADGLGGDQYETWGMRANKTNRYRFSFRTRQVDYFWNVTGDPHGWDLTRRNSDADLSVNLGAHLELTGTYRGFRQADSRRTTRLYSGEVFAFQEPLDQTGNTWGGGLRWRNGSTLIFVTQEFHAFTDNGGFGTRGLNTGAGNNAAALTFLEQREVRDMNAPTTRGGFQTRLGERLWLSGDMIYSKQDLDFSLDTLADGNDFRERPVQLEAAADGSVSREILHGNVRVVWKPSDRVSLSGRYRRRSWDQDGTSDGASVQTFPVTGVVRREGDLVATAYRITIDQFVFGAEWAVVDSGALFAEVGTGTRRQRFTAHGPEDIDSTTDATSYKFGGRWRGGTAFDAEASYEHGDIDNPFTRLAPGVADTVTVKLRARPALGWQISGTYRLWDTENDTPDPKLTSSDPVTLRTENWGMNVAYGGTGDRGRFVYAGYTRLKYDSNVPIRFVALQFGEYREGLAEYSSRDSIWSVGGEFRLADESPLTLYGRLSHVDSDGTVPLTYYDIEAGVRYLLPMGLFVDGQGRFVKYADGTELPSNVEDYTGTIVTVALGYRF